MQIVEIKANELGGHDNQSWDEAIPPEGYAVIPDGMELENFPFGEIETEEINGVMTVTKWTPGVVPEIEPAKPTPQEDTDAMLVDHEYRLTMLELGVNE